MHGDAILFDNYAAEIGAWKDKWVYSEIVEREERDRVFANWLSEVGKYSRQCAYLRGGAHDLPAVYTQLATMGCYDRGSQASLKRRQSDKFSQKQSLKAKRRF